MEPAVATVPAFAPAALEASHVGVWDRDGRGVVRGCPMTARIFGLTEAEAVEGFTLPRIRSVIHAEDRGMLERRLTEAQDRGGIMVVEYRVAPRPGVVRWVLSRGYYEPLVPGDARGAARGIVIDITESKMNGRVEDRAFFAIAEGGETTDDATPLTRATDLALDLYRASMELREDAPGLEPAAWIALDILGTALAKVVPREDVE